MSGKRMQKGVDLVYFSLGIERYTYERLLKLKIAEGDNSSFTKWVNRKMTKIVNENETLIKGYEVDHSDFD